MGSFAAGAATAGGPALDMPPVDARAFAPPAIHSPAPAWLGTSTLPAFATPYARPPACLRVAGAADPLDAERYAAVVASVRERVAREAPRLPYLRVTVLDASRGAAADMGRLYGRDGVASRTFARFAAARADGVGFASFVPVGRGAYVCAVTAGDPRMTLDRLVRVAHPGPVRFGAATAVEFVRYAHWHEVGHCLLGASEMRADAFALLVSLQEGASLDLLRSVAAYREASELTSPYLADDHVISPAAAWVARGGEALRSDARFMAMDLPSLAALADEVSARVEPDEAAKARGYAARASLVAALTSPALSGRPEGTAVAGLRWLAARRDEDPLVARTVDVHDRLSAGPAAPSPFVPDYRAFSRFVHAVAAKGDPVAAGMAEALDFPPPAPPRRLVPPPFDLSPRLPEARALLARLGTSGGR